MTRLGYGPRTGLLLALLAALPTTSSAQTSFGQGTASVPAPGASALLPRGTMPATPSGATFDLYMRRSPTPHYTPTSSPTAGPSITHETWHLRGQFRGSSRDVWATIQPVEFGNEECAGGSFHACGDPSPWGSWDGGHLAKHPPSYVRFGDRPVREVDITLATGASPVLLLVSFSDHGPTYDPSRFGAPVIYLLDRWNRRIVPFSANLRPRGPLPGEYPGSPPSAPGQYPAAPTPTPMPGGTGDGWSDAARRGGS